jgi:hypothetical protein
MIKDAYLKNVTPIRGKNRNSSHTNTWPLTFALQMKGDVFKIKTVLIIV